MSSYTFSRALRAKIGDLVQAVRYEEGAAAQLAAHDTAPRWKADDDATQAKADAAWQKERDLKAASRQCAEGEDRRGVRCARSVRRRRHGLSGGRVMSTTHDALKRALSELALLREYDRLISQTIKDARAAFDQTHAEFLTAKSETAAKLAEAEAQVRALALVVYDADKTNKKPVEGVGISLTKVYTYDPEKARLWALSVREQIPGLVETLINQKALDALVKAKAVPGVVVTEEPSATIAKDLSEYLMIPEPVVANGN